MIDTTISPEEKADELLKRFFVPFSGGINGFGSVATASLAAAEHVRVLLEMELPENEKSYYSEVLKHLLPDW